MHKQHIWAVAIALLSLVFADAAQAVNPTYYLQQKLVSTSPAKGNLLGNAVAVSANIALVAANNRTVGANTSQGAVYVYTYANQVWTQTATLIASDGAAGDSFGTSVALSGSSTAIVGAPMSASGAGAAYIFTRSGNKWTQVAKLTASDGASGDEFGFTVALDGGTAVVGALGHNGFQGAAYVYAQQGGVWADTSAFTAELTASDGAALDEFGFSVAVKSNTVVVGAPEHAVGGNTQQGEVYVFTMPDTGWTTTSTAAALLTSADGVSGDQFGYAVASTGALILAGAPTHTSGLTQPGAAYLYVEPDTGWATTSTANFNLALATGGQGGLFGSAVALTNSTAFVGAKWTKVGSRSDQGEVYLFKSAVGGWAQGGVTEAEVMTAVDPAANAAFGYAVATDGVSVFVGAPHYINSIPAVAGEAYGLKVTGVGIQFSDPGVVTQGRVYMISARATNYGRTTSQDVKVTVAVLGGAHTYTAAAAGKCSRTSLAITCDLGKLAPGKTQLLQASFMPTASPGKFVTHTVTLVGSAPLMRGIDSLEVLAP